MKSIQNLISYKKGYIDLSPNTRTLFLSKWSCLPTNGFQHKLKNIHEVLLLETILIWKKILWRINFVLIKFSLNALLFEKLRNEYKNPSFLHKVTCIRSDHAGAVAKFCIHGLYRGLRHCPTHLIYIHIGLFSVSETVVIRRKIATTQDWVVLYVAKKKMFEHR